MFIIEITLILKCALYLKYLIWCIFKYLTATDIVHDEHGNPVPGHYQYLEPFSSRLAKAILCTYLAISDVIIAVGMFREWHSSSFVGHAITYAVITTIVLARILMETMDSNSRKYKFEHATSLEELNTIHVPLKVIIKGTWTLYVFWYIQTMICMICAS